MRDRDPVETFLTLLVVAWFCLLAIDFGRGIFVGAVLIASAREASNFLAEEPGAGSAEVTSVAASRAGILGGTASNVRVEVLRVKSEDGLFGRPITVTVEYDLNTILPVVEDTYFIDIRPFATADKSERVANRSVTLRGTASAVSR
ncbi:MAG: hypothetical protein HY675_19850 [Chloroflexi bacterium]|nr:hypothetical protein [Chloroflexota bacterium]